MCLGMKPVVVLQFTLHPAYVLLQVTAVDNSHRSQVSLGLLDFLYMNLSLIHALSLERYFSHLAKQKIV